MYTLSIDFDDVIGKIKPEHGVGGGPVSDNFVYDTTEFFREAGFPFSRTHDIEYPLGAGEYIDIHCIFPDFKKDVNDPDSYNFTFTDEYLKAIVNAGAQVFYRLGTTIEHQPIKRYIHPPEDFLKWAQICEHIILHFNKGWANGFEMGIEYFEIWNEPDLFNRCWTGTEEQFFELYITAARHLKKCFPEIKIGGCAVTHPMSDYSERFLAAVRAPGDVELDFFSWHCYHTSPEKVRECSERVDELLEKYGFTDTQSIYDEWNYVHRWDNTVQTSIDLHPTAKCAAFCAGVLTVLQNSNTDIAMYYDAQMVSTNWNGLFAPLPMLVHGDPVPVKAQRPFYAFKAFGELYRLGKQVRAQCDGEGIYALAARGDGGCALMLARYCNADPLSEEEKPPVKLRLELKGSIPKGVECRLTDRDRINESVQLDLNELTVRDNSVLLITLRD